ncbi:hypothetical protein ACFPOA_13620 [Lysobacter niabensis]
MNRHGLHSLVLACGLVAMWPGLPAHAAGQASGYFRMADARLDV